MTVALMNVPLFPLNSIVLPRGRIPLQLFEPRYIDMLTRCLKEDRGFVVVLLQEGGEAGRTAAFYDIGTYVRIIDFQQLENGLLGITVEGESKVSVVSSMVVVPVVSLPSRDDSGCKVRVEVVDSSAA